MKELIRKLTHDELKDVAKTYLIKVRDFIEEDIYKEWKVVFGKRTYIIDVAALDKDGNVVLAIECGSVPFEKMSVLNELLPEVIHIPFYYGLQNYTTKEIFNIYLKSKHLKSEVIEQREIIEKLQMRLGLCILEKGKYEDKSEDEITSELNSLGLMLEKK